MFRSIMLLDDDEISNYLVERVLHKEKLCEAFTKFSNGEDAYTFLSACLENQQPLPDLVLLDLNMPVISGFEFLEKVKANKLKLETRIIAISNTVRKEQEEYLKQLGVHDIILKPVTKEKFMNCLKG